MHACTRRIVINLHSTSNSSATYWSNSHSQKSCNMLRHGNPWCTLRRPFVRQSYLWKAVGTGVTCTWWPWDGYMWTSFESIRTRSTNTSGLFLSSPLWRIPGWASELCLLHLWSFLVHCTSQKSYHGELLILYNFPTSKWVCHSHAKKCMTSELKNYWH